GFVLHGRKNDAAGTQGHAGHHRGLEPRRDPDKAAERDPRGSLHVQATPSEPTVSAWTPVLPGAVATPTTPIAPAAPPTPRPPVPVPVVPRTPAPVPRLTPQTPARPGLLVWPTTPTPGRC